MYLGIKMKYNTDVDNTIEFYLSLLMMFMLMCVGSSYRVLSMRKSLRYSRGRSSLASRPLGQKAKTYVQNAQEIFRRCLAENQWMLYNFYSASIYMQKYMYILIISITHTVYCIVLVLYIMQNTCRHTDSQIQSYLTLLIIISLVLIQDKYRYK